MEGNLQTEKEKLKIILSAYKDVINYTELSIKAMPALYKDNPDLLNSLLSQAENRLINLGKGLLKPYFARIDFTDTNDNHKDVCYIGKVGVLDPDNNVITVDWRAPIASLYYDGNVGQTKYEAPQGIINGTLDLKRQFEIEKGELVSFQDIDAVSDDELLKPYLGVNTDSRLKNIVASIQSEQNAIIREKLWKNIIVQGVAGSGKTTVALHRIAYLVYANRDSIKPEQYMVIGPNKFFINYISSVLPELDVTNVPQLTYEELAHDFVKEDFTVSDPSNKLISSIISPNNANIDKFKTSMRYKEAIDHFIADFEKTLIPQEDFIVKGVTVLPRKFIKQIYEEMQGYVNDDLQSKIERCILLLSKEIDNNYDKLISKLSQLTYERFNKCKDNKAEVAKIQKDFELAKKDIENSCKQSLRKYFSKVDTKILTLYNAFISHVESYTDENVLELKNDTLKKLKKKSLDFEDLAALIYLKERFKGSADYKKYRHTVVDEAQDLGEFNFYVLNKIMNNGTFSIFGDLAQSIYSYRGVDDWNSVVQHSFNSKCEVLELLKSYRTTVEIMEAANHVTRYIGLNTANPVIRHGNKVSANQVSNDDLVMYIYNKIIEFTNKGYQSIAVIGKTDEEAGQISLGLKKLGMNINHISSSNEPYEGGICTISSYLSKGLEFDAVIMSDVSENNYCSKKKVDMQLLYVSMTRPLHELVLIYDKVITSPLNDLTLKDQNADKSLDTVVVK